MNDDAESKLAAPKLFGRKKPAGTTPPATRSPEPTTPARTARTARPPRRRPALTALPKLGGLQIAGIAGILVGLFLVLATYGSLHLCASVRGAQTCGGKVGFPLLVAIGIVAVVGGGLLLRLGGVRSPMGDSFLAVALVAVVTVLFLGDHYDASWVLIVVPALSLIAYLLSHWVSTAYIDPADEDADRVERQ